MSKRNFCQVFSDRAKNGFQEKEILRQGGLNKRRKVNQVFGKGANSKSCANNLLDLSGSESGKAPSSRRATICVASAL